MEGDFNVTLTPEPLAMLQSRSPSNSRTATVLSGRRDRQRPCGPVGAVVHAAPGSAVMTFIPAARQVATSLAGAPESVLIPAN